MADREITFKLRAISDISDVTKNAQQLQDIFNHLKMPDSMKVSVQKIFGDIEKNVNKASEAIDSGFKTKGSITQFTSAIDHINSAIKQLGVNLSKVGAEGFKTDIDTSQFEAYNKVIEESENKINHLRTEAIQNLQNVLAKPPSSAASWSKALEAITEEEPDVDKLGMALEDLQKKLQRMQSVDQNTLSDKQKANLEAYTEGVNAVSNAYNTLIGKSQEVVTEQQKIQEATSNRDALGAKSAEEAAQKYEDLSATIIDFLQKMGQYRNTGEQAAQAQNHINSELDQFKNKITYFFGMNNAVRLFQRALRSAYETVKDLDKVMTETAVVTDFSVSDMWAQLPEYTARANELGVTIHDVYEASTLYYQQGLKTNEVMAVTNSTLRMARIAGLDAAEATDRVTNALRGFNMEITEANANNIADVYSKLAAISASDVDEISTAMTKTASLASSANMEFETTAAFLAQIIETTRESAETAGTALKTVIARFSEVKKLYSEGELLGADTEGEEIDVNKVSTALRTAGINLNEFLTGSKGLDEVFMELASKWDSLTIVQQRYIATMAAGSRQQSRFIALMSDYARTQELVDAAQNATGASQEQYEKTLDSLETKLNQLKNAWDEFVMGLAKDEAIKWVVDALTNLLGAVNKLTANLPGLLKTLSRVGIAFGAFKGTSAIFNGLLKTAGAQIAKGAGKNLTEAGAKGAGLFAGGFSGALQKLWPKTSQEIFQNFKNSFDDQIGAITTLGDFDKLELSMNVDAGNYDQAINKLKQLADQGKLTKEQLDALNETLGRAPKVLSPEEMAVNNFSVSLQKTSTAAIGAGAALTGLSGILRVLGFDKAAEITRVFGMALMGLGAIIPVLSQLIEALGLKTQIAGFVAQSGWLPFVAIIIGVIAVIGGLIYGIVQLDKALHPAREQLKAVNNSLEEIQELADTTKQSVEDLTSAWDTLTSAQNQLSELTQGTQEWRQALYEVNQEVLDLISKYPELAQYVIHGENGGLALDEQGYQAYITRLQSQAEDLSRTTLALQASQNVTEGRIDSDQIFNRLISRQQITSQTGFVTSLGGILVSGLAPVLGAGLVAAGTKISDTTGGLERDEFEQFLRWFGESGYSASNLSDADRQKLIQQAAANYGMNELQAGSFVSQIASLGATFDNLVLTAQQADLEVSASVEALVTSIVASNDSINAENGNFIKTLMTMSSAGESYASRVDTIVDSLSRYNKKELRQLYAQNIGGQYIDGKLVDDNGQELDIGNDKAAMRQAIAAAMASSQIESEVNNSIQALANSADEALRAVVSGSATNEQLEDVQSRASDIASLYGLSDTEFTSYIDTIINDVDNLGSDLTTRFSDLPAQLLLTFDNALVNATESERDNFINALSELLSSEGLSAEEKTKIAEGLANSLGSVDSIDSFIADLNTLAPNVDFSTDALNRLREASIKASDALSHIDFSKVINSLGGVASKISARERNEYTGENITALQQQGIDTSSLFTQVAEDSWTFIGDFEQLELLIANGMSQVVANAEQNVEQLQLDLEQTDAKIAEATQWQQTAQAAYDELSKGNIEFIKDTLDNFAEALKELDIDGIKEAFDAFWYRILGAIYDGLTSVITTFNLFGADSGFGETLNEWRDGLGEILSARNQDLFGVNASNSDDAYQELEEATTELEELRTQQQNLQAQLQTAETDSVSTTSQAIAQATGAGLQQMLATGQLDSEAATNALIGRLMQYEDLVDIIDALRNAETETERQEARMNAVLQLRAKDSTKAFEGLKKVIDDNTEALNNADIDAAGYQRALSAIAEAARDAFGENTDITDEFVEANLEQFQALAQGSEEAEQQIRVALVDGIFDDFTFVEDGVAMALNAINSLNGAHFDADGTMDASQIFTELAAVMGDAEQAAALMNRLGYTVTWEPNGETELQMPDPNNPGQTIKTPVPNYRARVTDGFGNLMNGVRGSGGGGSGGGGGGGSSKDQTWKNPYDELYNLTEQINEALRTRNKIEDEYDRLLKRRDGDTEALYKNSLKEIDNLQKEIQLQKQLRAGRLSQLGNVANEKFETSEGEFKSYAEMNVVQYASYDPDSGLLQIDWNGIDAISDTETGKAVEAYVKRLEELQGQIEDTDDTINEMEDTLYEIQERGKEEALDMEERIADALYNAQQKIIDDYKELSDTISNSNDRVLSSLQDSIDLSRQIRDNTKTESDIAKKESRLAYLRRDTSGANELEARQLEQELADARESYGDTLIDQSLDQLNKDNEQAREQRERQIEIMQSQLDYQKESGVFAREAEAMLIEAVNTASWNAIEELLKKDEGFEYLSTFAQEQWLADLETAEQQATEGVNAFLGNKVVEIIDAIEDAATRVNNGISQTSSGSGSGSGNGPDGNTGSKSTSNNSKIKDVINKGSVVVLDKDDLANSGIKGQSLSGGSNVTKGFSTGVTGTGELISKDQGPKSKEADRILDAQAEFNRLSNGITNEAILLEIRKQIASKYNLKINQFKTGGLADFTGPAWLDGSKSHPELVLNAKDTENFIALRNILSHLMNGQVGGAGAGASGDINLDIDVNVEQISSDYDVDQLVDRIKQNIYQDASYRNIHQINFIR